MKIILFLILLMFVIPVDAICCNTSWNYRIESNVSNGTYPYQFSLNVSNSTGINNVTHVFCNGHCNINVTDIRFTDYNGNEFSHWVEDNVTGKVFVNVTVNGIVYMYYGNLNAASTSNGTNTFPAFSDLDNLNGFSEFGVGSVTNGIYTSTAASGNYYGLYWNQSFGVNYSLVFWAKTDASYSTAGWHDEIKNEPFHFGTDYAQAQLTSTGINYRLMKVLGTGVDTAITVVGGTEFYKTEIIRNGNTSVIFRVNNVVVSTEITYVPTVNLFPRFTAYGSDGTINLDNFYVRKYVSPEPIWGIWGVEQLLNMTISSYSVSTIWNSNIMSWNNSNTTWVIIITPIANIQWFINNSLVQNNIGVISSAYSNSSAKIGNWNVTGIAINPANSSNSQSISWTWIVADSTLITKFEEVMVSIS